MSALDSLSSVTDQLSISNPLSALQGKQAKPAWQVQVDGIDITQNINRRLISLTMTDSRGFEADTVELVLDDSDGKLTLPRRGATLSLSLGWAGERLIPKGQFTVDELEHSGAPDTLTIRGKSVDLRDAMQAKREKSYHQQTLSSMVESIAARHELGCVVSDSIAGQFFSHIDQHESDCAFLTRLAKQVDGIATVKSGKVVFFKAGEAKTASGKPLSAVTITRSSGDGHRFAVADRDAYTGVIAYWHDQKKAVKQSTQVKRKKKKATITASTDTVASDTTVNKTENELLVGSRDNVKTLRHTYANQKNAERAARAEWERLQRGVAQFSITLARGRPELFPELPVKVSGYKPQIDAANWLISRVVHQIDDSSGYTNSLELEVMLDELPE
jgi:uncharacterized protein